MILQEVPRQGSRGGTSSNGVKQVCLGAHLATKQACADLGERRLGIAFGGVVGDHVGHLVAEHGGQLVVIGHELHHAGRHPDLAAGQDEGVHGVVLEDRILPGLSAQAGGLHDLPTDPPDPGVCGRVARDLFRLLHLRPGLGPLLREGGGIDEQDLLAAQVRIVRTGGQQRRQRRYGQAAGGLEQGGGGAAGGEHAGEILGSQLHISSETPRRRMGRMPPH